MNTSGNVMEELSHNVRRIVDDAVIRARQEGRKTLMDRDFQA
jgi:histone H3/H4